MTFHFEHEYFTDRREFFAYLPVKTNSGWAWGVDCVEISKFCPQNGWRSYFERLPRWR